MKSTQLLWVKQQLRQHGQVSRNDALANYISRLGAIILVLKREGWKIEGEYGVRIDGRGRGGRDYFYNLKQAPVIRKVQIIDGRAVVVAQQAKLI